VKCFIQDNVLGMLVALLCTIGIICLVILFPLKIHAQSPLSDTERITALELRLARIESLVFPQISATQVMSPVISAAPLPTLEHRLRTLKVDTTPTPVWANAAIPKFCPYCGANTNR